MRFNFNSLFHSHHPRHRGRQDIRQQLLSSLEYLERHDFSKERFARLHPPLQVGRYPNLAAAIKYYDDQRRLQSEHLDFAHRVNFVANVHRWNEGNFDLLINRSLEKWPLHRMAA